ncbi:MAG: undecaprenyl-diphosphate phosphatase, partial [Phycisphaerales bacterium]|nr:undecaprenyl-diphosphate phosphatase [Phycisphaerales bacterium]
MNGVDYPTALVLGLIQGLTEFLPVSSSAHLVIAQKLYGLDGSAAPVLLFDLVAHVGTVASMWIVFATPLWRFMRNLARELTGPSARKRAALTVAWLATVATAVTAAIGFGFKDAFERSFDSMGETGVGLMISGTMLFVIGHIGRPRRGWRRIGWWRAA